MRDQAIQNALQRVPGRCAFSGSITVGTAGDYVAISFDETPGQENTLVVLKREDAETLTALLVASGIQ